MSETKAEHRAADLFVKMSNKVSEDNGTSTIVHLPLDLNLNIHCLSSVIVRT